MIAVSRAPIAALQAYKRRMGWSFTWVSESIGRMLQDKKLKNTIIFKCEEPNLV